MNLLNGYVTCIGGLLVIAAGAYLAIKGQIDSGLTVIGAGVAIIGGARKLEGIRAGLDRLDCRNQTGGGSDAGK